MRDPCGIHVSAEVRGYMQDTYMMHARLIKDTCGINVSAVVRGYMRDTWLHAGYLIQDTFIGIRVSQMYPERYVSEMQDTCGIHARYMYLQG